MPDTEKSTGILHGLRAFLTQYGAKEHLFQAVLRYGVSPKEFLRGVFLENAAHDQKPQHTGGQKDTCKNVDAWSRLFLGRTALRQQTGLAQGGGEGFVKGQDKGAVQSRF